MLAEQGEGGTSGGSAEAEQLYREILEREPDNVKARFRWGYLQLQRNNWTGAAESFERCLQNRTDWPEAQVNLALAYWKQGKVERAEQTLTTLLAAHPDSRDAIRGLATTALERQDLPKALTFHEKLIATGEKAPEVLHNTGLLCHQLGQLDKAVGFYREALAAKPDFAEVHLNLGHTLRALDKQDEAREAWLKALDLNPELAAGYFL